MRIGWILLVGLCLPGMAQAEKNELITKDTRRAMDAGLAYLVKEQSPDGAWGTRGPNVAVTSLTGLALLSAGHQPDQGEIGKRLAKTLRFVLSQQHENGYLAGKRSANMYGHGYALQFLADIHAKLSDKKQRDEVKAALERAVKLLVDSQSKAGGWRYEPNGISEDITVTSVEVAALHAAREADITVPQATLDQAVGYIKACQIKDSGGFRYMRNAGTATFSRTAAALAALNRAGIKEDEAITEGLGYLQKFKPGEGAERVVFHYSYGHFYATQTMWYAGDKEWKLWYPAIRDELIGRQKDDRWVDHANSGCPHQCTAMALIILQMPHGHLRSMKR